MLRLTSQFDQRFQDSTISCLWSKCAILVASIPCNFVLSMTNLAKSKLCRLPDAQNWLCANLDKLRLAHDELAAICLASRNTASLWSFTSCLCYFFNKSLLLKCYLPTFLNIPMEKSLLGNCGERIMHSSTTCRFIPIFLRWKRWADHCKGLLVWRNWVAGCWL